MKKITKFLHKALEGNPAIEPALTITEALYMSSQRPSIAASVGLKIDDGMDEYFDPSTAEHSDIRDAFDQSHRVETHIQPRSSCFVSDEYDTEVHIRFYRAGEKSPIYRLSAALADGKLIFCTKEAGLDFIRKSKIVAIERLSAAHIVPFDNWDWTGIGLSENEFLRVQYTHTMNDWPPRGGDYFRIQHFKKMREVSTIQIKASPCYEYLVDIGHGLVLYPHGKGISKDMPFKPVMHRCTEWAVRKFNPTDWNKDVPMKPVQELKAA